MFMKISLPPGLAARLDPWFPPESIRRRMAGGSFWLIGGAALAQSFMLAVAVVSARLLGLPGYGKLGLLIVSCELAITLATAGFTVALAKRVAELRPTDPAATGRAVGSALSLTAATGAAAALAVALAAEPVANGVFHSPDLAGLLRLGAPYVLFSTLNYVQAAGLMGLEAFRAAAAVTIARNLLLLPLVAAGGVWRGIEGMVFAYSAATALSFLAVHPLLRRECRRRGIALDYRPDPALAKELFGLGFPAFFADITFLLAGWGGLALLAARAGFGESGLYNAAAKWQTVLFFFVAALSTLGIPILSDLARRREGGRFRRALGVDALLVTLPTVALAVPVLLFPRTAMTLFGTGFAAGGATLAVVGLATVLMAGNTAGWHALWALGDLRGAFALALFRALLLGSLPFLLVSRGAVGLAWAHLIAQAAVGAALWLHVGRLVRNRTRGWES
jgi:O-antigen/teichoic acid export membrane protein